MKNGVSILGLLCAIGLSMAPATSEAGTEGDPYAGCIDSDVTGEPVEEVEIGETVTYRLTNRVTPECRAQTRVRTRTAKQTPGLDVLPRQDGDFAVDVDVTVRTDAFEVEVLELCVVNQAYVDEELGWQPLPGAELCEQRKLLVENGRPLPDVEFYRLKFLQGTQVPGSDLFNLGFDVTVLGSLNPPVPTDLDIAWGFEQPPPTELIFCEHDVIRNGSCYRRLVAQLRPGAYTAYFCLDPADRIRERLEEENNCASLPFVVLAGGSGPDLRLDSFGPTASPPQATVQTGLRVRMTNAGGVAAGAFSVAVVTPEDGLRLIRMSGLAAYAEQTVVLPWTPGQSGMARLEVELDVDNEVDEISESNNEQVLDVQVAPAPPTVPPSAPKPDLYIGPQDLTISPANPETGTAPTFTACVRNIGDAVAEPQVRLTLSAAGNQTGLNCAALPPGETCCTSFPATVTGNGSAYAVADPENLVDEHIETNNDRILYYNVVGSGVTCAGTWNLTGVGHGFNTSSQGSVVDACRVYWGQNTPSGCWASVGVDGLSAVWHRDGGSQCPTRATVTASDGTVFEFDVSIVP